MKYKLIKTYPGSPELNYIAEIQPGTNMYFYNGLQIVDIHNYPEFWQPETEYNLKWANSILGNMTVCAGYLSLYGHADLCKQLKQQTEELFDYFENNLK